MKTSPPLFNPRTLIVVRHKGIPKLAEYIRPIKGKPGTHYVTVLGEERIRKPLHFVRMIARPWKSRANECRLIVATLEQYLTFRQSIPWHRLLAARSTAPQTLRPPVATSNSRLAGITINYRTGVI